MRRRGPLVPGLFLFFYFLFFYYYLYLPGKVYVREFSFLSFFPPPFFVIVCIVLGGGRTTPSTHFVFFFFRSLSATLDESPKAFGWEGGKKK